MKTAGIPGKKGYVNIKKNQHEQKHLVCFEIYTNYM